MHNSTTFQIKARTMLCTSLAVLLTACGGGSGTDTSQTMPSEFLKSSNANLGSNGYVNPTTTPTTTSTSTSTSTSTDTAAPTTTITAPTTTTTAPTTTTTSAYNYYVATTGSDSNPGTQSAPFKTILKASQVAVPDSTVHVAPGTYIGGFQTTKSGTASGRIRYVSDTKWGAKLIPPVNSTTTGAWRNTGSYTDIIGFEIDGTVESAGTVWREGIYQLGSNNTISNCHIHHIAKNLPQPDGYGAAGIVNDNYSGGINDDVDSCLVHDIGPKTGTQVHGIYQSTNGKISNNIVYNIQDAGITSWHNANHINMVNNTVFNTQVAIIVGSGDKYGGYTGTNDYTNVSNNIVFDNVYGITEQGTTGIHNTYTNNLVYQNTTNWVLKNGLTHSGTISADPQFVNYIRTGGGDYHLKSTSPALDKGSMTYAPTIDFDGVTRYRGAGIDIGSYEK